MKKAARYFWNLPSLWMVIPVSLVICLILGHKITKIQKRISCKRLKIFLSGLSQQKKKIRRATLHIISQEHKGAPIYWSHKILFSIFWKGMKRKSYYKTRFCVSHEGLSNGLGTFGLTWYMFENKTKNMFLIWRGSNVLEPRLQYNGARAPIYWSHQFFFPIRQ